MATVKGTMLGLKINGLFVQCETSCDFSFETETIPSSDETSGGWEEFVAGLRSWSVSVNGNLLLTSAGPDIKTVLDAILLSTPLEVAFATKAFAPGVLSLSGKAFPQSGGISAPAVGKANWNVSFQGTGPFTLLTS